MAADDGADEASVEATWGFINRNFYDQSFNGQDWAAAKSRYLERARKGEGASRLTREMVGSLQDRWSRAIDAGTYEQLMAYDPLGVGVVLTRNENKDVIVSSPPFKGSAADRAGLKAGDVVAAIDGKPLKGESLFTSMDRVTQADRAEVLLSLERASTGRAWEETLPRARTASAAVDKSKVDSGVVAASGGHKVGYLRLRNFGARSALDMSAALQKVRSEGADELVLDLRSNLGGSFQAAIESAALFLEPNSVATRVTTPSAEDKPLVVNANEGDVPIAREPLVLLVDERTASASEVLSAALRGNCRATLLGTKTYGKAAVQGVFGLPNSEAVALTVAKYSGPGGLQIGDGLRPDGGGPADNPLSKFGAAIGLPADLSPSDYARVDFGAGREEALRMCRQSLQAQ